MDYDEIHSRFHQSFVLCDELTAQLTECVEQQIEFVPLVGRELNKRNFVDLAAFRRRVLTFAAALGRLEKAIEQQE